MLLDGVWLFFKLWGMYSKSHFVSLLDQLEMMFNSQLRQEYEKYITQQAAIANYKSLISSNLKKASDLTVANLYWYFRVRDKSEDELNTEENEKHSSIAVCN